MAQVYTSSESANRPQDLRAVPLWDGPDLRSLLADGKPRELTCITQGGMIQSAIVGNSRDAVRIISANDRDTVVGWYIGVNPVDLPCRPLSSERPNSSNVPILTTLFLDFDTAYPEGETKRASTDAEMALTIRCRDRVHSQLVTQYGFPLEPLRYGITGNGAMMLWKLSDLPNTPENLGLIRRATRAIAEMVKVEFPNVHFDTGVTDPVRIRRISGTTNRRGEKSTPEHPWRACDLQVNDDPEPVPIEVLTDLASQVKQEAPGASARVDGIKITDEEADAIVDALKPAWRDGYRHPAGLAASGYLWHLGVEFDTATKILSRLSARDEKPWERLKTLKDTYTRGANGDSVAWHDGLKDMLTELQFGRVRQLKRDIRTAHTPSLPRTNTAAGKASSQAFPHTDTGNAERLAARFGQDIRFNYSRKVWLVFTGTHWGENDGGQMDQLAKDTVRSIPGEAEGLEGEAYTKLLKHASNSEQAGKRAAMIDLARSEPSIPIQADELDSDPWLLNVANGTLDLRTCKIRDHDRDDLITRCLQTSYQQNATCPTFLAFLNRIFAGNTELIAYIQRMFGYALTGSIREQAIYLAYGNGSNGKSTLLGIWSKLLGDYATEADTDSFLERQGDRIREDVAALEGARFVSASETADGKRLSEAFVKKATGGEKLRARRLFENGYVFEPKCKVWLSTNHRPQIIGTDHAIWRRIRLIPFTVTIPDSERDRDLPTKLESELTGILAWAVEGCRQWLANGEQPPATVLQATAQYRRDMDALANWLEDRCELKSGIRTPAKDLYADYVNYCGRQGEDPLKQRTFGTRLTERGCGEAKSGATRYRTGIRLIDPDQPTQSEFEADPNENRDTRDTRDTNFHNLPKETVLTKDATTNVPNVPNVPNGVVHEEMSFVNDPFDLDLEDGEVAF